MVSLAWEKWKHIHTQTNTYPFSLYTRRSTTDENIQPIKNISERYGFLSDARCLHLGLCQQQSAIQPVYNYSTSIMCSISCKLGYPSLSQSLHRPHSSSSLWWTKPLWSWSGPPLTGSEGEVTPATVWSVSSVKQGARVRMTAKPSVGIAASPSLRLSRVAWGCSQTRELWDLKFRQGEVSFRAGQCLEITQDSAQTPALSSACPVALMCSSLPARLAWRPPGWWWASLGPTHTTPSTSTHATGSPRLVVQGHPRVCQSQSPPTKPVRSVWV